MEADKKVTCDKPLSLGLTIGGLDVDEAGEVMRLLKEIGERDPSRRITCNLSGLEHLSREEALRIIKRVCPEGEAA